MMEKRNGESIGLDNGPQIKRSRREPGFYVALNDGLENCDPGEGVGDSADVVEIVHISDDDDDTTEDLLPKAKNESLFKVEPKCLSLKNTVWELHCNIHYLMDKEPVIHNKQVVYEIELSCRYCTQQTYTLSACGLKSNNFYKHLKRKHKQQYDKHNPSHESNDILRLVQSKSKLERSKRFRNDIVNFFIENYISFHAVDSKSFKALFRNIDLENQIGSSKTLRKLVIEKYQEQYEILIDSLKTCVSFSLQLDVWRSPLDNRSYLGVIVVYIVPDTYKKETYCLALKEVTKAHTGDELAQIVYEIITSSSCLNKLNYITCDSASNNSTLCSSLAERLQNCSTNEISFSPENRINCLAHVLNRILQCLFSNINTDPPHGILEELPEEVYEEDYILEQARATDVLSSLELNNMFLKDSISKITEFFKSVHNSTNYNNCWYSKKGKQAGLPPLPIEIRWNSVFTTIHYFMKNLDIIKAVEEDLNIKILSSDEIYVVSFFSTILELFHKLTLQLSSNSALISTVIPVMYFMDDILTELIQIAINLQDDVPIDPKKITINFNIPQDKIKKKILREKLFTTSFLNALQKSRTLLSKYWTRLNNIDVLYNSMLLDPRFKHQRLKKNVKQEEFETIFEEKRDILKRSILKQLKNDSYIRDALLRSDNTPINSSDILFAQAEVQIQNEQHPDNLESVLNEELGRWFFSYQITYVDDVLNYWKIHQHDYPMLSRYVLYIFDIPCSSVAVERLFSIGRNVYGVRKSLKAKSAESLIFLTFNSKD